MASAVTSHPLRRSHRPTVASPQGAVRAIDLFAGCGGLSLGLEQAAHAANKALEIELAVDFEALATAVYSANFPDAKRVATATVESLFDGELGSPLSVTERSVLAALEGAETDIMVGGPPCQGHSNLNNHTRRVDSKNGLYLRMVRAIEVVRPRVALIENVPAVRNDRHAGEGVVEQARVRLASIGYVVDDRVIHMEALGVAQLRRRHVMLAIRSDQGIEPSALLDSLPVHAVRDLEWAIGDLQNVDDGTMLDRRPQATATNLARMAYLLETGEYDLPNHLRPTCQQGNHSYKSMYGRLNWSSPAQTITSGFGSIGQGRYMHPQQARALTAHEAARIQGFPDYFDFSACPTRQALATMIGNAVPPALTEAIVGELLAVWSKAPADDKSVNSESA